jgi:hypothetical protein
MLPVRRLTTRLADNEARTFFNGEGEEFATSTPNPEAMLGEGEGYRTYPGPGLRKQAHRLDLTVTMMFSTLVLAVFTIYVTSM